MIHQIPLEVEPTTCSLNKRSYAGLKAHAAPNDVTEVQQLSTSSVNALRTRQAMWAVLWKDIVKEYAEEEPETATSSGSLSSDDDDEDEEEETGIAQALVRAAFSPTLSTPDLAKLVMNVTGTSHQTTVDEGPVTKKARVESDSHQTSGPPMESIKFTNNCQVRRHSMKLSVSAPSLLHVDQRTMQASTDLSATITNAVKPDDLLREILTSKDRSIETFAAMDLEQDFFEPVTEAAITAYDMPVVQAVREAETETLHRMKESGRDLNARNKFGESVLHICCRRGSTQVLDFLLQQVQLSPRVCCDYGRTPLHDACWTSSPNFAIIDMLTKVCPDLWHVRDKRGFTPLEYVSREQWNVWGTYLRSRSVEQLAARELM